MCLLNGRDLLSNNSVLYCEFLAAVNSSNWQFANVHGSQRVTISTLSLRWHEYDGFN